MLRFRIVNATLDFMVRYMHQQVGLDLPTAVRMASLTLPTIIGLQDEIASLAVGGQEVDHSTTMSSYA